VCARVVRVCSIVRACVFVCEIERACERDKPQEKAGNGV